MTKSVNIGGREYTALFNTGSKFSIISDLVFENLNGAKLNKTDFQLVGFGQNKIRPHGQLKYDMVVDKETYNVNFEVVSSKFIDAEFIIGEVFCKYAEIDIRRDGLHFRKITSDNECHVMKIDIMPDEKTTNVEMTIVLKEEAPIFSLPSTPECKNI